MRQTRRGVWPLLGELLSCQPRLMQLCEETHSQRELRLPPRLSVLELEFKLWSVDWRATLFAHGHPGLELGPLILNPSSASY